MNYEVELKEPVKCPQCGDWATLYIDTDTMIGTYRCVRNHIPKPTRQANKKEKALAMKTLASEVDDPKLKALANLMVSIIVDK